VAVNVAELMSVGIVGVHVKAADGTVLSVTVTEADASSQLPVVTVTP
jgi:hypothetical protein